MFSVTVPEEGNRSTNHRQRFSKISSASVREFVAKLLSVVLSFAILIGCDTDASLSEPPPQLLDKDQMVSFLIDLHLAEAKMNYVEAGKTDSLEILFRNYEAYLMSQHGFTDSVYLDSYAYYLDHMELLDDIYSDVVDSLSVMNSQQKAQELEQPDPDS